MDETPVFLDMVPNKVIDSKGKKSIRVRSTNSGKKSNYSCVVLHGCRQDVATIHHIQRKNIILIISSIAIYYTIFGIK